MNILPRSLHIGVLRGGPSHEYEVSIKSGGEALRHLSETHSPIDIFISRDGLWHMNGVERVPERILKNVDVVLNTLHGAYGEDGGVQEILTHSGVPYVGSDRFSSAIAMNKWITKDRAKNVGIKTPVHIVVRREEPLLEKAQEIWTFLPHPLVVKPANSGSSLGVYSVVTFEELVGALEYILSMYPMALVEEYIHGQSVSCIVTDNFRGEDLYSFPPTEKLSRQKTEVVEDVSKQIHNLLGLRHYSKSDFVVAPRKGVYFLEVNTTPKFSNDGVLTKSLQNVGVSPKDFTHHLISLALGK